MVVSQSPELAEVVCLPKPFRPSELMSAVEAAACGSAA
jgi:hypothetical protein